VAALSRWRPHDGGDVRDLHDPGRRSVRGGRAVARYRARLVAVLAGLADQALEAGPQIGDAFARPGAGDDHLIGVEREGVAQLPLPGGAQASGQLVALGEGRQDAGLAPREQLLNGAVVGRGLAAAVEQPQPAAETGPRQGY